jgi:hypothetical protein
VPHLAWYRYVTLSLLARAWLALTRAALTDGNDTLVRLKLPLA